GLEDCDGHGTEVAGIIAANTPPSIGFKGVAPDARIISIRQTSQNYGIPNQQNTGNNSGSRQQGDGAGNLDTLAEAVRRAADRGRVKVINMSIDNCRPNSGAPISPQEARLQAAVRYAVSKDIVVVAAAGNISTSQSASCMQNNQPDPNKPQYVVTPPWFSD